MANTPIFPAIRHRRLRQAAWLRDIVAEHCLLAADLIWPLFIQEGTKQRTPINAMPGVFRLSIDDAIQDIKQAYALGIRAVALFPVVEEQYKTLDAKEALNADNLICHAIKAIKEAVPNIGIIADVALDPYTSHGQDGLVENGYVVNDATVAILAEQAVILAQSGADVVAPSDMMDGRIAAIRNAFEVNGLHNKCILSYAAKYASAFYGPFRDAVGSKRALGAADKRTYQMNPANSDEALREVAQDIAEGADMVMIKPGLPYLDIIQRVHAEYRVPTFAYHVSGEYTMLKASAAQGVLDYEATLLESLIACKRAGATAIFTYGAIDAAKLLNDAKV